MKNNSVTIETTSLGSLVPYSIKAVIKNKKSGEAFEIRNLELPPRHLSKHSKNSDLFGLVQCSRQNTLKQIFPAIQDFFSSYKEQVELCIATAAVGAIFLGSILIFFIQLAEYGW